VHTLDLAGIYISGRTLQRIGEQMGGTLVNGNFFECLGQEVSKEKLINWKK
jgi:hypothetical protein